MGCVAAMAAWGMALPATALTLGPARGAVVLGRPVNLTIPIALDAEETAYVGDDLPDLAVMHRVGFSIAVANAHPWVRERAHWRTRLAGGAGAAREVTDLILAAQGKAEAELAAFLRR